MKLIEQMDCWIETEQSIVRAQLMREDVARLRKLVSLVESAGTETAYAKDGLYIGWTQGDFTTHQLKEEIQGLMSAVYAHETGGRSEVQNQAVYDAWIAFHNARVEKLVHCK